MTLTNTTGRLTSQSTASPNPTGEVFSYDQLGRVKINSQCTPQNCSSNAVFPVTYTYDLLGDLLTSTNGASVTLTYAYNIVPALTTLSSSLSDSNHPGTLFSSAHYNSAGSLLSATLGGSVNETRTYDARLRLASIADGSNYSLTIPSSGGYAPNSDILTANDSVNSNWLYAYDDFNRLICSNLAANGTCASPTNGTATYTYDYDRYGNRWQQNGAFSMQLSFSGNNNRMDSHSYDAAGNLLSDGTHSYFYDAENRLIQVDGTLGTCSSATACYVYNASGQRVRKTTGSTSVDYLYDLAGNQITELGSSGSWNRGEVYGGGRHLATYEGGTTNLIHADWLGTERVRTTAAGASCETIASLAFGDGESTSGSCGDPSPMHFTGKQRDPETALDFFEARFNSSNFGRFMSPDPENISAVLNSDDPQAWDGYAYGRNNPLRYTDPAGLNYTVCDADGKNCVDLTDKQYEQYRKDNPDIRATPSGDLYVKNPDGTETKVGSESYYNEKIGESLQQAGRIAQIGLNYSMLVTAPNYLLIGGAHFFLGGGSVTPYVFTPRFVPWVATSPALTRLINWMYQESDKLWDGTAGALRSERLSGEGVEGVFHSQKAADIISAADNLLKSQVLSAHDQAVAKAIIQKLTDAATGN